MAMKRERTEHTLKPAPTSVIKSRRTGSCTKSPGFIKFLLFTCKIITFSKKTNTGLFRGGCPVERGGRADGDQMGWRRPARRRESSCFSSGWAISGEAHGVGLHSPWTRVCPSNATGMKTPGSALRSPPSFQITPR